MLGKLVFFYFRSKGGRGGLGQSKKKLSENTQIFLTKGGGVSPNPKGFYQIFWHNLPKKMGVLYKKLVVFLTIFCRKGGGLAQLLKVQNCMGIHSHAPKLHAKFALVMWGV